MADDSKDLLYQLANDANDSYLTIDPANFLTPDMGDFIKDNVPLNYFKDIEEALQPNEVADGDNAMFYIEEPYSKELGYHPEADVFTIKSNPIIPGKAAQGELYDELNRFDGDTMYFTTKDINDGNNPVEIHGLKFKNFREYIGFNNIQALNDGVFGVRFLGINAPEIPHYEVVPEYKAGEVKFFKFENFKKSTRHAYDKTRERNEDTKYPFVVLSNDKEGIYREVINGAKGCIGGKEKYTPPGSQTEPNDSEANKGYLLLVSKDESDAFYEDGFRAKALVKEMLSGAEDIIIQIDGKTLSKRSGYFPAPYNLSYFNDLGSALPSPFAAISETWKMLASNVNYKYLGYNAFGQDNYKRYLGAIYVKKTVNGAPVWINLNKYVLARVKNIDALPNYTSDSLEESHYGFASDAFKLWTYKANDAKVVDSLMALSKKDFDDRRTIQKNIMGIDFDAMKDYTMMIGDCLFMVPPTSIRAVSQTSSEKMPFLRSKGSMMKSAPKSERLIEMTLYFNDNGGINGVPYETKLPNGKEVTYYMNGLRSLISMFKFTPFLPIENHYINDVLQIEAVSLANIQVSTMPNYPRCIAAVLTLQEFNYSVYLSELPKPDADKGEHLNKNLFASTINYELMRYYYQRAIQKGESLKDVPFESEKYLMDTFGSKTALLPMNFESSNVEFYVIDKNYLEYQLQLKLAAMDRPFNTQPKLTESGKSWKNELAKLFYDVSSMGKSAEIIEQLSQLGKAEGDNKLILNKQGAISRALDPTDGRFTVPVNRMRQSSLVKGKIVEYTMGKEGIPQTRLSASVTGEKIMDIYADKIQEIATNLLVSNSPLVMGTSFEEEIKEYEKYSMVMWKLKLQVSYDVLSSGSEQKQFFDYIAEKTNLIKDDYMDGDSIVLYFSAKFDTTEKPNLLIAGEGFEFDMTAPGFKFLQYCAGAAGLTSEDDYENADSGEWDNANSSDMSKVLSEEKDALDTESVESLKFLKYETGDIKIKNISAAFGNTLTNIGLQALDGVAPQYAGGQDTVIELTIETMDENAVLLLNHLPRLSALYAKEYRLVLPCWPLRLNSEITKLLGVNEVLVESVDTNTVPNHPGLFTINMRLISVDRTMRNKEALKKLDSSSSTNYTYKDNSDNGYSDADSNEWDSTKGVSSGNAGFNGANNASTTVTKSFFEIKKTLSQAEIYPDLELPTLDEMAQDGFKFIRYSTSPHRVFPDPDFYFVYGHVLAHELFRQSLLYHLNSELLKQEGDKTKKTEGSVSIPKFELFDKYGAKIAIEPQAKTGFVPLDESRNKTAQSMYEKQAVTKSMASDMSTLFYYSASTGEKLLSHQQTIAAFANTEVYQAWDVSDSIRCMLREKKYETALNEQDGKYVAKIEETANKIIEIINSELSKPMVFRLLTQVQGYKASGKPEESFLSNAIMLDRMSTASGQYAFIEFNVDWFVDDYFKNGIGKKLLEAFKIEVDSKVIKSLKKMLKSAAAAASGAKEYDGDVKKEDWKPRAFINPSARFFGDAATDNKKRLIPIVKINGVVGQGHTYDNAWASDIDTARTLGTEFGTFQIKKYKKETIEQMLGRSLSAEDLLFLDPYYGQYGDVKAKDEEVEEYKNAIMISPYSAAHAFIRNVLVYMKKMLEDKVLLSLFDMIQEAAIDNIEAVFHDQDIQNSGYANREGYAATVYAESQQATEYNQDKASTSVTKEEKTKTAEEKMMTEEDKKNQEKREAEMRKEQAAAELAAKKDAEEQIKAIKDILVKTKTPMALGKLFAPVMLAATGGSQTIYSLMKDRNYPVLNDITRAAAIPTGNVLNNLEDTRNMRKLLLSLVGYGLIKDIGYIGKKGEYLSEYMDNIVNEKIYLAAAENPMAYIQHSFYDMIVNDKRGRMLRAFPTYYMMFIDEGREIGLWKLHDNFYNMSAIAEIQVVKSRKIAADTANITMSNMFKSYTTDDEDQKEGYQYDWKDAFTSVFSPRVYFIQEEIRRQNAASVERVRLQPGARIHLRMGYGADASTLPILFNGSIAEVGAGEVVQIVAQGDGVELTNPILTTSDAEDVKNEDRILISKQWHNWITRGATPRTILASLLTTRGGWIKKTIRNVTNGRFFNDNPYGIVHFGEPDYKDIFPNGEVVQNLYEALKQPAWHGLGVTNDITDGYKMESTPKLSTHIFGKSFWDIMHICASVEPDFMASIVPFGFRSSIFYGAPRYYYAYDYEIGPKGQVTERRKPFQQYHIYTSYTDIIANSIKASEKDVRTCAIGLYSKKKWLGRESAGKVGPMWADFDIYPEKQKTMTVDTQLIAKGTAAGDIIPFLNWLQNDLADGDGMIQGGYQIAWRMTASALKNSIKDMYQGEVMVIGDPSIKPYDKVYIDDIFERMQGAFEVEAVVHNFTVENGYTTSVYADCITTIDDRHERISQHIGSKAVAQTVAAYTSVRLLTSGFTRHARPLLTALAGIASKSGTLTTSTINNIAGLIGKQDLIDNEKFLLGMKNIGKSMGVSPTHVKYDKYIRDAKKWADTLGKIPKDVKPAEIGMYYQRISETFKGVDPNELIDELWSALDNKELGLSGKQRQTVTEALKELKNHQRAITEAIKKTTLGADEIGEVRQAFTAMKKGLNAAKDADKLKEIAKMEDKFSDLIKNGKKLSSLKDLEDLSEVMIHVSGNVKDAAKFEKLTARVVSNMDEVRTALKAADKMFDTEGAIMRASRLAFGARAGFATLAISMALEIAVTAVVSAFIYEYIERWMKNLQVVQVFPLKQNGKVLTAGLDGNKGIVVGSPTEDDPGMIEGWIGRMFDEKKGFWGGAYNMARDFLVSTEMKEIAEKYMKSQGLPDPDSEVGREHLIQDLMEAVTADEVAGFNSYKAALLKPRVAQLSSPEGKIAFRRTAIKTTDAAKLKTPLNEDMVPLIKSEALQKLEDAQYLFMAHKLDNQDEFSLSNGETIKLSSNDKKELEENYLKTTQEIEIAGNKTTIPVIYNKKANIVDLPFLRPDAFYLMLKVIEEVDGELNKSGSQVGEDNALKEHPIVLRSALRANDRGWACTGLGFRLQVVGFNKFGDVIKRIAEDQAKALKSDIKTYTDEKEFYINGKVFAYKPVSDDTYDFMMYPTKTV